VPVRSRTDIVSLGTHQQQQRLRISLCVMLAQQRASRTASALSSARSSFAAYHSVALPASSASLFRAIAVSGCREGSTWRYNAACFCASQAAWHRAITAARNARSSPRLFRSHSALVPPNGTDMARRGLTPAPAVLASEHLGCDAVLLRAREC